MDMNSSLRRSMITDTRLKKSLAESLIGDSNGQGPDKFSFTVKPNTVLCLVQDCGKLFKRRMDMMKHNIVHLLQKPDETEVFNMSQSAVKKNQLSIQETMEESPKHTNFCSVADCGATYETDEGLNQHINAVHTEIGEMIDNSECCTPLEEEEHTEMGSPSEAPQEEEEEEENEMDELLKLAIVENRLLRERIYKNQQAALMYQQYLQQCQNAVNNTQ